MISDMLLVQFFAAVFVSLQLAQCAPEKKINCEQVPEVEGKCCAVPEFNPVDIKQEDMDKCFTFYSDGPSKVEKEYQFECAEECIFKKYGFMNEDNSMSKQKFTEKISEVFANDSLWNDTYVQGVNMCIDGAPNMVEKTSPCKSGAGYFTMCLGMELIKNCPKQYWTENADCIVLKEYLEKCPYVIA